MQCGRIDLHCGLGLLMCRTHNFPRADSRGIQPESTFTHARLPRASDPNVPASRESYTQAFCLGFKHLVRGSGCYIILHCITLHSRALGLIQDFQFQAAQGLQEPINHGPAAAEFRLGDPGDQSPAGFGKSRPEARI